MTEENLVGILDHEALKEISDSAARQYPDNDQFAYRALHLILGVTMKISVPNRVKWLTALSNSAEAFAIELEETGVSMKPEAIEFAAALILAVGPSDIIETTR
jgi:hypothetical protein